MRIKRGRDQYDFDSNNVIVIAAVCLQHTRNWTACMGKVCLSFFLIFLSFLVLAHNRQEEMNVGVKIAFTLFEVTIDLGNLIRTDTVPWHWTVQDCTQSYTGNHKNQYSAERKIKNCMIKRLCLFFYPRLPTPYCSVAPVVCLYLFNTMDL